VLHALKVPITDTLSAYGAHTRNVTPFAPGMAPMPGWLIAVLVLSAILFSHFAFEEAPSIYGKGYVTRFWGKCPIHFILDSSHNHSSLPQDSRVFQWDRHPIEARYHTRRIVR
jgi:hypothetical protein